jgi:hypothetical protein
MLSKYAVYYIILSSFAALSSIIGAAVCTRILMGRSRVNSTGERHRIEQLMYLANSSLGLGLVIKLSLVPAWFFLLQSLLPSVPGAMCLAGMHQNVQFFSLLSSCMKLFLPILYISWLVLSKIDKKFIYQPFQSLRAIFYLPLTLFILIEIGSDFIYLFSLEPVSVSCCLGGIINSDLTVQSGNIFRSINLFSWLTAGCYILLIIGLLRSPYTKFIHLITISGSICTLAMLLFSFHMRQTLVQLPDYFTNKIYHQCIFCLLQSNITALLSLGCFYLGGALTFAVNLVFLADRQYQNKKHLILYTKKLRLTAVICLVAGLCFFGLSF